MGPLFGINIGPPRAFRRSMSVYSMRKRLGCLTLGTECPLLAHSGGQAVFSVASASADGSLCGTWLQNPT